MSSPKITELTREDAVVKDVREKAAEAEKAVDALEKATKKLTHTKLDDAGGAVNANAIVNRGKAAVASATGKADSRAAVKTAEEAVKMAETAVKAAQTVAEVAEKVAETAIGMKKAGSVMIATAEPTAALAAAAASTTSESVKAATEMLTNYMKENLTAVVVSRSKNTDGSVVQISVSVDKPKSNDTIHAVASKIVKVIDSRLHTPNLHEEMEMNLLLIACILMLIGGGLYLLHKHAIKHNWQPRHVNFGRGQYSFYVNHAILWYLCALSFFYFATSVSITELNKYIVSYWQGGFKAPLGMTAFHFVLKACFACFALWVRKRGERRHENHQSARLLRPVDLDYYFRYIVPMGVATGLDVALINVSIQLMTVSSITVIKTSGILWTMIISIMCGILEPSFRIFLSVGIIVIGLVLANLGEGLVGEVNVWGFLLVMGAVLVGSIKSVLVQIILQGWTVPQVDHERGSVKGNARSNKLTPLETVVYMAPPAIFVLLIGFFTMEWNAFITSKITQEHIIELISVLVLGAFIVFGMVLAEMNFNMNTSSLTIDVVGTIKQLLLMVISFVIFGDKLTVFNMSGMVIVLFGVVYYAVSFSPDGNALPKAKAPAISSADFGDDNNNSSAAAADEGDAGIDEWDQEDWAHSSTPHRRHVRGHSHDDSDEETAALLS